MNPLLKPSMPSEEMSEPDHILVVDDSPTQLRQMQIVLEKDGFLVQTAVDGKNAMQSIQAKAPLMVVTDLQMPEMNGLELVAAVKASTPSIPVLSLIHISEPTRLGMLSRMPSSA